MADQLVVVGVQVLEVDTLLVVVDQVTLEGVPSVAAPLLHLRGLNQVSYTHKQILLSSSL